MLFCCKLHADVTAFNHYGFKNGLATRNIKSITEDHLGFLWVGTSSGLFKFNGTAFDQIDTSSIAEEVDIQHLSTGHDNEILIGTKNHGLLIYENKSIKKISSDIFNITKISDITKDNKHIWLATDVGLFELLSNNTLQINPYKPLQILQNKKINAIEILDDHFIAIAQRQLLYLLNTSDGTLELISLDQEPIIHDLYHDTNKNLWIATSQGIFRYDWQSRTLLSAPKLTEASRTLSIDQYKQDIWVASIGGGVYQINVDTLKTQQHTKQSDFIDSLSDENIMSIHISKNGMLWAGGFSNGLNSLNLNLLGFNFETFPNNSIDCGSKDPSIFSLNQAKNGDLWIGKSNGVVIWNPEGHHCQFFDYVKDRDIKGFTVYHTNIENHRVWISSSVGLLLYDINTMIITSLHDELNQNTVFFTHKRDQQHMLVGTSRGLYEYDVLNSTYEKMNAADKKYENISYRNYIVDKNGDFLFPTTQGVLQLTADSHITKFTSANDVFSNNEILAMAINDQNELFISVWQHGLYHLNANRELIHHYFDQKPSESILQIIPNDQNNKVWLSGYNGIIALDLKTQSSSLYASLAADNYLALTLTSFKNHDNDIFFGGHKGFVHFNPKNIKTSKPLSPLLFNELYLMNDVVKTQELTQTGFKLTNPIEQSNHLEFSHKDKIISFEFIQLNYDSPIKVNYSYKLNPVSSEWTALKDRNRHLTFTNLKSGNYQLDVEASHFNNKSHRSISFVVKTAPWLSWWAFALYALCTMALIYWLFKRKIAVEKKINTYLNEQVKQKTQTVEDLLARKNEIFSNVSHEFRTPLTLILGPIEELYNAEKEKQKKDSLDMVSRNAKQLLNLVNQMLKLAHVNEIDTTQKHIINLSHRLNMVIEPFAYLAKKNSINLTVKPIDNIKLYLTEDALEIIFSNFLSNAIKYIGAGNHITIGNEVINNHINVFVQDNGPGIEKTDQDKIFKRFNRLHQGSIQGVGIGLALVKEVAELNQAKLAVTSEMGQGAKFSVSFPIDDSIQNHNEQPVISTELLNSSSYEQDESNQKHTVLIIDDNKDMRQYINDVLNQHFTCMLASDGSEGIAKALKYVPDIIVCDVMMPKVNGFQVSRQLRKDPITSHIPLVLLTALDEKTSRIKGWRENIDLYLNKPFDAQELILQLKGILNTRYLLSKKPKDSHGKKSISYLSKDDQNFIDKLNTIVEEHYTDPLLNLEKMASFMLVSDRQLQRKTTALINQSPTDFLREYRLKKATTLLIDGKRVSYTSDVCGFSSISYFSYSFKKHFGMTAKQYQKLNQEKSTQK